ncbi:hypothetical protein F5879DRAFT_1047766 [Lentinula edodes]|nr:hypothetical protein F5879DRAFT_1047766 [Lentinula edodes]
MAAPRALPTPPLLPATLPPPSATPPRPALPIPPTALGLATGSSGVSSTFSVTTVDGAPSADPVAMQVDRTPSSSAIVDPTMRIKDESVSSFPTQSGNGLEHTDTEIIGDLNRDLVDEVWAQSNDGQNDEGGEEGTGKLRRSLELSGHEEYEARCTNIDEDRDTDSDTGTENLIGRGCAYTSFSIAFSISPTSSTSISQAPPNWMIHLHLLLQFQALRDLQQLPILNSLQRRPLAFCTTIVVLPSKPVSSVKRRASKSPDATPLFKRAASSALEGELDDSEDSVPPPQTGLPDIPLLASRTNYISGFSGVLHHSSKYEYGAGDVHPRKRQDIVETTKGCASSLISSSVSPHVLRIDHSDPLNVADSSLRTYKMLDSESISLKDLASSPLVDAPNTTIKSNDQLEEILATKISDNENETSPLDASTSVGQSLALSSGNRTAILVTSPLKRKHSRSVEHLQNTSPPLDLSEMTGKDIIFAPSLLSPSWNTTPSASGVTMPEHPPRKSARTENIASLSTSQRSKITKRPLTASASSNSVVSPPASLLRRARSLASVFTRPGPKTLRICRGARALYFLFWKRTVC